MDGEIVREALVDLCRQHGFDAAAEVLRVDGRGYMTLDPRLADTRDGREEAISCLQCAFQDGIPVIIIAPIRSTLIDAVESARGGPAPTGTQGFA